MIIILCLISLLRVSILISIWKNINIYAMKGKEMNSKERELRLFKPSLSPNSAKGNHPLYSLSPSRYTSLNVLKLIINNMLTIHLLLCPLVTLSNFHNFQIQMEMMVALNKLLLSLLGVKEIKEMNRTY